ncbi:unnamed protein product [Chrysoparadoxa australica]
MGDEAGLGTGQQIQSCSERRGMIVVHTGKYAAGRSQQAMLLRHSTEHRLRSPPGQVMKAINAPSHWWQPLPHKGMQVNSKGRLKQMFKRNSAQDLAVPRMDRGDDKEENDKEQREHRVGAEKYSADDEV